MVNTEYFTVTPYSSDNNTHASQVRNKEMDEKFSCEKGCIRHLKIVGNKILQGSAIGFVTGVAVATPVLAVKMNVPEIFSVLIPLIAGIYVVAKLQGKLPMATKGAITLLFAGAFLLPPGAGLDVLLILTAAGGAFGNLLNRE